MTRRFSVSKVAVLAAFVALTGCSSYSTTPVATEPDLVGTRIAQAAEKAATALDAISNIEQQRTPIISAPDDSANVPSNLAQPITVRWTGPMEQMVKLLADRAGLRYVTRGRQPPVPITVVVDVQEKPLIEVLRSVGLQAGQRADLNVDSQAGLLEIRYAPADRL